MKKTKLTNNLSVNLEEITDMELETISGGLVSGDGGCIPTKKPPYPPLSYPDTIWF